MGTHIPRVKWKYKGAVTDAKLNGIEEIERELVANGGMQGILAELSVIIHGASQVQIQLLKRAGYGREIPTLPTHPVSDYAGASADRVQSQLFLLSLEETFYISDKLHCIAVTQEDTLGKCGHLFGADLWMTFVNCKRGFSESYAAYSHLRLKGWFLRPGIQYGADYTAYRHHPMFVHSEFAVVVIPGKGGHAMQAWQNVHALTRLCGSVSKRLLLLYVHQDRDMIHIIDNDSLKNLSVEEVIVKRWLPEKNRN